MELGTSGFITLWLSTGTQKANVEEGSYRMPTFNHPTELAEQGTLIADCLGRKPTRQTALVQIGHET